MTTIAQPFGLNDYLVDTVRAAVYTSTWPRGLSNGLFRGLARCL
jgi:hypothetical protein